MLVNNNMITKIILRRLSTGKLVLLKVFFPRCSIDFLLKFSYYLSNIRYKVIFLRIYYNKNVLGMEYTVQNIPSFDRIVLLNSHIWLDGVYFL